ncbi:MAG: exodeoxyribonuclease III [Proteobacteria bacterium]|nr:exodeoxyribonuclease III [Pseudomonadota bacterium]
MSRANQSLRILSWNVNGLRAIDRNGFFRRWLSRSSGYFVGVQEVRARCEQLPRRLQRPKGFFAHIVAAERKGYSGVGLYARDQPDRISTDLGVPEFDREGRVQIAEIGPLVLANVYFPNGSGCGRDNSRVSFKLAFYRALFERLERYRKRRQPVLVMGDFNTAHREIDLARPRENRDTSGFLPRERAELSRWFDAGWVDTFRAFQPDPGHYTWWSQRKGVRERNIGWRIDYILACPRAAKHVRDAFIWPHVRGSDHCPLGVELDPAILARNSRSLL